MDSYGYIEVVGLVPAIAAADAALKAANVEVVGRENTGKAMIAVIIMARSARCVPPLTPLRLRSAASAPWSTPMSLPARTKA